jgi:hypothetical protein
LNLTSGDKEITEITGWTVMITLLIKISNIELNIKDREKQSFKPTFSVFKKTRKAV